MLRSAVWFTTYACNFKCHYCWEVQAQAAGLYKPAPFGDSAGPWVTAWNRLKPRVLDITGGEPFLLPWFVDLIEGLDPEIKLGLTTNLSHDLTGFVQRVPADRFASVTCSFHPTENGTARHPMNPDLFLGRCLLLKNRGFRVSVNYVVWPEQLWLIADHKARFERHGLRFHVDPYSSISYYPIELTEAEQAYAAQFVGSGRATHPWAAEHGPGYRVDCDGGLSHLNVQPDGTAHRCILDHKLGVRPVGNVLDPAFELYERATACTEHWRCPGCDRDKVRVRFAGPTDAARRSLPLLSA